MDLTTVHQDAPDLAQHAVALTIAMLEGHESDTDDVVLEPKLVVRSTTTPPR